MKAQTKLTLALIMAIIVVVVASQSANHREKTQNPPPGKANVSGNDVGQKAQQKQKKEATRDLSSGSENTH